MLLHFLKRLPIKRFGFSVTKFTVISSQSDMSTLAVTPDPIQNWLERLDQAIQSISNSAQALRVVAIREKAALRFYFGLIRINRRMVELEVLLNDGARALQSGSMNLIDPGEEVDPEGVIVKMGLLYNILYGIYSLANMAGLKHRMLTKREVKKLGDLCEQLLDYTTWLKDAISEDYRAHAETTFADGMRELEAGETVAFL